MADPKAWRQLATRLLFKHPRMTLVEDEVVLPSGEVTRWLRFDDHQDFVSVVCLDAQGRLLLARQYNHPAKKVVHELPGGLVDEGENPEEAARRELVEEVGLYPHDLARLGAFYPNPRRTKMRCHVFLARELEEKPAAPSPEEFIASEWLELTAFEAMIQQGRIENGNLLAAWSLFRVRYPDLVTQP
jgi:ADP-ribose pyrophosphatase